MGDNECCGVGLDFPERMWRRVRKRRVMGARWELGERVMKGSQVRVRSETRQRAW